MIPYKSITDLLTWLCCNYTMNVTCLEHKCFGCKDKALQCKGVSKHNAAFERGCRARRTPRTMLVLVRRWLCVDGRILSSKMDNETANRLIEIDGSHSPLLDTRRKEYHNNNVREDLWDEIAKKFVQPKAALKLKIKSLLRSYRRERNKRKNK
ncbi:unnamed protein product [Arctia plantaginis]|uniref:MADF domain-containing protein n=1 Tax=Arctia plantaginis TaxID=874455 RepID=A0A8S0Z223_ARCPL|nr:unnamed protein product [Arctia plantaginis]